MKKLQYIRLGIYFAILLLAIPLTSNTLLITFDDQSAFLTATGATATDPLLPDIGMIPGGSSGTLTVGDLTFTITSVSREFFSGSKGHTAINELPWTYLIPGNHIAISGPEHLSVDLASPVYSFGFDFVEMENINPHNLGNGFIDSTFTVTLLNFATPIDSFTFNAQNDVAAFVGVWGDSPFNRVEIHETIGGTFDEYYGQFYTGTAPIPEPATMLLLGSGLIGLVGFRRKFQKG